MSDGDSNTNNQSLGRHSRQSGQHQSAGRHANQGQNAQQPNAQYGSHRPQQNSTASTAAQRNASAQQYNNGTQQYSTGGQQQDAGVQQQYNQRSNLDRTQQYNPRNAASGMHSKAQPQQYGNTQQYNASNGGRTQQYSPSSTVAMQTQSQGQSASASGFRPATAGSGTYGQYGAGNHGQVGNRSQTGSYSQPGNRSQNTNANHGQYDGPSFNNQGNNHDNLVKVRKKRRKAPKIILNIFIILLALILIAAGALALWVNSFGSSMSLDDEDEAALADVLTQTDDENDAFYMLILGSDSRDDGDSASRSDVTMLVRIDPSTATVDLISIPRDTMVTIGDYGTQKINAAYAYGGAAGAVECVSEFAGVSISHYAEVYFDDLEEVVDELGGIWVDIPEDIEAGNGGISFEAGEQLLDGEQALAFARERYNVSGGDFGRAQAQRLIVEAIVDRVLSESPSEIPSVINQLASSVSTDYTVGEMITLAQQFIGQDITFYSAACPSYTLNQDGISYVATEFNEWQAMMQRVDAGLDPNDEDAEIPEEQLNNTELGAATNSPAPRDYADLAASAGLTTDDVASTDDDEEESTE